VVSFFDSDAKCVRYLKTFRAMPLTSKLMDLSFVLSPLTITWMTYLIYKYNGTGIYAEVPNIWRIWLCLAGLWWLGCFNVISQYLRGYFAQQRGIQPAPPHRKTDLSYTKAYAILWGVLFVALNLLDYVLLRHHTHKPLGWLYTNNLLFLVMFFQSLSMYTRSRFWNVALE
jgi:hypothetical protein